MAQPLGELLHGRGNRLRILQRRGGLLIMLARWSVLNMLLNVRALRDAPTGSRDLHQIADHGLACGKLAVEFGAQKFGAAEPLAEAGLAFVRGRFQPADRALGDLGRGDQFGDGGAQSVFVGLAAASAAGSSSMQ